MIQQADSDLEQYLGRKYPGRKVWVEGDRIVIRIPTVRQAPADA
jgi:hypothetical protein